MSYTKSGIEKWEEFEEACLVSGIDAESFCGTDDLFEEFEKFKKWRAGKKK